jgi:aspartyl-tRNA(Asn)/glutamyl-tRNA(Gln) amidotransferase subunit B
MRSKEEAHDYRYFPDPDLLPLELQQTWVDEIKAGLPELPDAKRERFVSVLGLSDYDASVLAADKDRAAYFEEVAEGRDAKLASNWVNNELYGRLNKEGLTITDCPVSAAQMNGLVGLIEDKTISGKIAKDVFEILWAEGGDPAKIVEDRGLKQVTDTGAIEAVVDQLIADNPDQAASVREKPKAMGWFVGQVMKAMQGKANPQAVNEILQKKLLG